MSLEENKYQNVIHVRNKINDAMDFYEAMSAPLQDKTLRYGQLSLNTESGLLKYKDRKPILLQHNSKPFPLMKILIFMGNEETTYDLLAKHFNTECNDEFKEGIRSTIRDVRRRLGINSKRNPEENIFIPTGNGYKVAS